MMKAQDEPNREPNRAVIRCVAGMLVERASKLAAEHRRRLSGLAVDGSPEIVIKQLASGRFQLHTCGCVLGAAPEFVCYASAAELVCASQVLDELRGLVLRAQCDELHAAENRVCSRNGALYSLLPVHCTADPLWKEIVGLADRHDFRVAEVSITDTEFRQTNACLCGKTLESAARKSCGACRKSSYCSKDCQLTDWHSLHKLACKHVRDA